jgi:hypothetical protein
MTKGKGHRRGVMLGQQEACGSREQGAGPGGRLNEQETVARVTKSDVEWGAGLAET